MRQNLSFISSDRYSEVLVLSGDHVYCMDYGPLVAFHRERKAHVTIGMIPVSPEETRHFGTATLDRTGGSSTGRKRPQRPGRTSPPWASTSSTGQYLTATLKKTKEEDFGKQIIPRALKEAHVYGYPFEGYWRDVGTMQAYWDANMDLLKADSGLTPEACDIRTNHAAEALPYDRAPARISASARAVNSAVSPGCVVSGAVEGSVLSPGVVIEKGAFVKDSIIMHDTVIRQGARIERSVTGQRDRCR